MVLPERWNAYWFPERPVARLAVARILAVSAQLFLIFVDGRPLANYEMVRELAFRFKPLAITRLFHLPFPDGWIPPPLLFQTIFWITIIAGVLALIGLLTNVSLAMFAVGNLYMTGFIYSFGVLHHGDAAMMIALATLALSPSGAALSADSLLRRSDAVRTSRYAQWPFLFWVWMFSLIYLSAAFFKLRAAGLEWLNGHTLSYYLLLDGLKRDVPLGIWLAGQHGLAVILSYLSLLFESIFFLTLVFPALGVVLFPVGALFHAGIWFTMEADFWEYAMLMAILTYWWLTEYYPEQFGFDRTRFPGSRKKSEAS